MRPLVLARAAAGLRTGEARGNLPGAGIFVLTGIAAGVAGPAAWWPCVAFALGVGMGSARAIEQGRDGSPRGGGMTMPLGRCAHAALAACLIVGPLPAQNRTVIETGIIPAGLPFSSAVKVGNLLFLSGQIGNIPGTRQLADTGVAGQTRQTFENMKTVLAAAGSSLSRVVKCTVFLVDMRDYAAMNQAYAEYFPADPPARSTVAGTGLALGARVEIECIATVGP
jgi:reactive intermediate/imine deaminase